MEDKKYISFEPWSGGFSNIRQSYETIAALSIITGRTIILPPKMYCLFFTEFRKKNTFIDIFDALDKEAFLNEFDCVDYYDISEYTQFENEFGYFDETYKVAKLIEFKHERNSSKDPIDKYVLQFGKYDTIDFKMFSDGRESIDLNLDDKFIHFPLNLFTQFYYHVYADVETRNLIREKIKRGIKFKKKFYDLADVIKTHLGPYNAIHIRRNDFLHTRPETTLNIFDGLLNNIQPHLESTLPLYIATDESNRKLFYFLKGHYNIAFLEFFHQNLSSFDAMVVEQIICANAEAFLGSEFSTFTHYIHVLRGQMGKKDYHRIGVNYNYGVLPYKNFPWLAEKWEWQRIFDLYWKNEVVNTSDIFNLGYYGSHNSAIAISKNTEVLEVVEIERWVGIKNAALSFYPNLSPKNVETHIKDIIEYFNKKYGVKYYHTIYLNSFEQSHINLINNFNIKYVPHHEAHASNALYQSPYEKALIVSFDGGSDEGYFNIYLGERGKKLKKLYQGNKDLAVPYAVTAQYLKNIKKEKDIFIGNLIYSGKLMGLSSYGKLDENLIKKYRLFYHLQTSDNISDAHHRFKEIFKIDDSYIFDEEMGNNMARCNQYIFEESFKKEVQPFIDEYVNDERKLIFSGGGSMNIINNTLYDAFVSPNSDDRGIALGCLLWGIQPNNQLDATYLGSEPYDELTEHEPYSISEVINDLVDGKILGLIQGRSEHGARSLGNRSIICLPKKGMKEILNERVKHRESFRPFAPICTLEDAPTYFEFSNHSRWMLHNAKVKEGFEEELGAIIHVDGTARLQTITKEQNEYLYKVLTGLKEKGLPPILLNTSFNIQGKPILNTYKDALWMRDNTGLDKVITNEFVLK
jgi:carbamoyltransferase